MSDIANTKKLNEKGSAKVTSLLKELPEPMLGHMVVEVILEDTTEYLNTKKEVPEDLLKLGFVPIYGDTTTNAMGEKVFKPYDQDTTAPITKGVVVSKAPDCYGEVFKKKYGSDIGKAPEEGDIVVFPPQSLISVDAIGKYQLLADKDVIAIYRKSK